jgi:membrane-associated protease RseP (regulator of RpoE activity)
MTLYAALSIFFAVVATSLLFVLSLALHESGHAVAGHLFGLPVRRVTAGNGPWLVRLWRGQFEARLFGLNGGCEFARPLESEPTLARFCIALAGPLSSLGAAGLFAGCAAVWDAVAGQGAGVQVCMIMAQANIALALFNLLPIPPLDGWRALEAVLEQAGVLRLTPSQHERVYRAGLVLIMVATAAFFAWKWGLVQ